MIPALPLESQVASTIAFCVLRSEIDVRSVLSFL